MKYGDLTYEEIRGKTIEGCLAVVPTGCTEQQGPHLPVDFDTWFAENVSIAASEKAADDFGINSLVLPALPFGPTPEHRNYGSGFIDIPKALHEAVAYEVLSSLAEQGFRQIVIWRGCGEHDFTQTVKRFNTQRGSEAHAYLPELPYSDVWRQISDPSVPGGHADSFTTSLCLYLRPGTVRTERIVNPYSGEPDWSDPDLDFSKYSSTGVIGDPTRSSSELGKKLWEAVVARIADIFRDIAKDNRD